MRNRALIACTALLVASALIPGRASSHREEPLIALDRRQQAQRSEDPSVVIVLYHAAAIAHARREPARARSLVKQALDGSPNFDLVAAPEARRLEATLGS